ncbi:cobaltochelatase CobN subunit [Faunimonas pinastri]|uniref:Cobaltochelatase subunit CobN n=1 Tax=Faunimonas pinastri TaxID=1855383 RepID=A0A1H9DFA2_9HYPH|nr:cobaltochelatase subunit CobN [Faunimonas pinastri]SEQ11987.1 cobaltochelatase CobN subunit [Faunimonas pinastri]
MHILNGQTRGLEQAAQPVDLGQTPGDIVILTAADTEVSGLAAARRSLGDAFPSLRLANWMQLAHPYSVDLFGEQVLARAKLVVVRLLGGASYWRYGLDEAVRLSRACGTKLVVIPGDATWDAALAAEGNVAESDARLLWSYLVEGGAENFTGALRFCAHLIGKGERPPEPSPLSTAGLYRNGVPSGETPVAGIVFYRALMQAGQTEPVDALCEALKARGIAPLPIFVSSLKAADDAAFVERTLKEADAALVLNATSFAISRPGQSFGGTVLDGGDRPVLQVTFAGVSEEAWVGSTRGLSPTDLTMNVVLPEVDGRIIGRAVSFKETGELDPLTECRPVRYRPRADRIAFVADLAARWATLRRLPSVRKRVGLILSNYPNRDGRLANGVGLDAPASTAHLLRGMRAAGYATEGAPETGEALMALLLAGPTNALESRTERTGGERLSLAEYRRHFSRLPESVQAAVTERWGDPADDPFVADGAFLVPAHRFGNVAVGIQPARGYNIDPKATYHDPDLVPPHGYFAFYIWLREEFGADALVHMGKHGNLEWLPGKALALSGECFPEAVLGPLPVIYPFIVNDPGEGAQAKRRTSAVVVDHLMPPMARAESHGAAAELEALIDEYAAAQSADERRAKTVATQIFDLAARHGFDRDLGLDVRDRAEALGKLDEHICDLKELQIRDGLHVFGTSPEGRLRAETLVALARVPRGSRAGDASLTRALADDLHLGFDPLAGDFAEPWSGPKPEVLQGLAGHSWRIAGDTVERLEALSLELVQGRSCPAEWEGTAAVLQTIRDEIAPSLDESGTAESAAVLAALAGRFVPPGPSGAPTRGRSDCLPTGRNFYSVDVRSVPTRAAWNLGQRSADLLAERYFQDEGEWPTAMALTVWGTSNMRTGGDDIAQALALIGARPVWEPGSGRVTGMEVIPLSELRRPRVDVTLRISGFFRDAFPAQITLFHQAVQAVAAREDEPADGNPVAARIREDAASMAASGIPADEAREAASYRIFGSKPGAYGAGLQALIDEGIWAERKDLAAAFLEWSAYAYGKAGSENDRTGLGRQLLETRLAAVDAVVQNQDNREHDLLDSDDYYQFEGGLAASVETLKGQAPRVFHNDHSRPERPVIRSLDQEIARVVRGRAANPKWIAGVMRHGYKGAFEIVATVDYLFAFAATTNAVGHHHFEQLYDAYIADETVRRFIAEANAPALREIAGRLSEAVDRGLWTPRRNSAYHELKSLAERAQS